MIGLLLLLLGLAIAGPATAQTLRQEGYPPPALPPAGSSQTGEQSPGAGPSSYPPPAVGADGTSLSSDNALSSGRSSGSPAADAQQGGTHGLLFLWLGFLATLLIFITSVVGAITLFERRNET